MASFFDDIITPNTLNSMKHLGENFDSFNMGIRQLLSFQFLLYDSLNELAAKFAALKTDVTFLQNQVFNIDDAVANYMKEHPIEVYTRDGVPIDDVLETVQEKLKSTSEHLNLIEEKNQKFECRINDSASRDTVLTMKAELEETTEVANETARSLKKLQKQMNLESTSSDSNIESFSDIFRRQFDEYTTQMDKKADLEDLKDYVKHSELEDFAHLFQSVPELLKSNIPKIIPKVMSLPNLSTEEKIRKAYELLHVERKRVNQENQQLIDAFQQLKETTHVVEVDKEERAPVEIIEIEVKDVGTFSGTAESSDIRIQNVSRNVKHISIGTNFDGPENIVADREVGITELFEHLDNETQFNEANTGFGYTGHADIQSITSACVQQCQGIIERQLDLLMNAFGVTIDKNDIKTLVTQLSAVEEMRRNVDSLLVKINLKIDKSIFFEELKRYMLKEEFYEKCGGSVGLGSLSPFKTNGANTLPKVTSKGQKRPKTEQKNRPVPLVPARNPYMLGVNDKYLKGKDNKFYLRETSTIGDRSYKEPPITGANKSYFERSKMAMEVEGFEAVVDFQPFVPANEVIRDKKQSLPVVQVDSYQIDTPK